jgi:DNA invertase Pin-like site-specific DNA recombinase
MTTTTSGQTIGYVRTSSIGQNDARQLDGVAVDKTFTDTASGKDTTRPQLQALLAHVRAGDHVKVHSMDRLSRSLADLEATVTGLTDRGVDVTFVSQSMTFTATASPMNTLMLQMLGAVAQFERSLILERQREGIAIAKAKGVYTGRKASLNAAQAAELKEMVAAGVAKTQIAKQLGVSRATVYAYMKS